MIQRRDEFWDNITKEKLNELLKEVNPILKHRSDLYERYIRKTDNNNMMSSFEGINEQTGKPKLFVPFEYHIINLAAGYLTGKAPEYTVSSKNNDESKKKADEYQEYIDNIMRYNDDEGVITDVMRDFLITGAGYIFVSENENNETCYTPLNSRQTVVAYGFTLPYYPTASIRKYIEKDDECNDITKIEIITAHLKRVFLEDGTQVKFIDYLPDGELGEVLEKEMMWGNPQKDVRNDVPIAFCEHPDGIALFEPVIELINAYQHNLENLRSMTHYNDYAKLMVAGFEMPNDAYNEETNELNEKGNNIISRFLSERVVFADDPKSLINWLIKEVNYEGVLATLRQYVTDITLIAGIPNTNIKSMSSAQSGDSKKYDFYSLDQYAIVADRQLKKCIKRLWEIITNRINLKNNTDFDFRQISVFLPRNVPTDKNKDIVSATQSSQEGIFSEETTLKISNVELDVASEINRKIQDKIRPKTIDDLIKLYNTNPKMFAGLMIDKLAITDNQREILQGYVDEMLIDSEQTEPQSEQIESIIKEIPNIEKNIVENT